MTASSMAYPADGSALVQLRRDARHYRKLDRAHLEHGAISGMDGDHVVTWPLRSIERIKWLP